MNLLPSLALVFLATYCLLLHRCTSMGSDEATGAGSVFDHGRHAVILTRLDEARPPPSRCPSARRSQPSPSNSTIVLPPKPLLIAAPREAGEYPVLLFLHGYLALNSFYSQLLQHVASHGFIAVAPQLYTLSGADTTAEIDAAARVIAWLSTTTGSLASAHLPLGVRADLTKLSVAGHSRGGKVAFALALGLTNAKLALPLAALVAVDPVDGMGVGRQTPPPVLTCGSGTKNDTSSPASLHVGVPVLVIGTGLGELPRGPLPPCAPRGVSHAAFYEEVDGGAAAKWHLVARDYGHTDMMDDETPGARGVLTRAVCRSGGDRKPMRRFVAGATVAFLRRWVVGDAAGMDGIRDRPEQAPVALSVVEFRGEEEKGMGYRLQEEPAAAATQTRATLKL